MFGKLGDMMGRLKEMKAKAEEAKQNLENSRISVDGAGGDIQLEINGNKKVLRLHISPGLQFGDTAVLEENLKSTLNKAVAEADKLFEEEMKKAAGGIIPGF